MKASKKKSASAKKASTRVARSAKVTRIPSANTVLDLTKESGVVTGQIVYQPFQEKPYDSRPQEDSARRRIAYSLISLLGVVVIWALLSVIFLPQSQTIVMELVKIILGPIIALVSAATGFYFGAKSKA